MLATPGWQGTCRAKAGALRIPSRRRSDRLDKLGSLRLVRGLQRSCVHLLPAPLSWRDQHVHSRLDGGNDRRTGASRLWSPLSLRVQWLVWWLLLRVLRRLLRWLVRWFDWLLWRRLLRRQARRKGPAAQARRKGPAAQEDRGCYPGDDHREPPGRCAPHR